MAVLGGVSKVGKSTRGRTGARETPLVIRGNFSVDEPTERRAWAKVGRALSRMAPGIERVTVRFEDVNGPRGGADTRCRMKAVVSGAPSVVVERAGRGPEEALARTMPGLRRALRDLFDRRGGRMPAPTHPEPRVSGTPRKSAPADEGGTAKRNWKARRGRMNVALEDSQTKPSRKSTRGSANRARGSTKKTQRERRRAASPRARHRTGK